MFRIFLVPFPSRRWGPDVGPRLDAPISRSLVLLSVFFSTYIMSRACILSFKTDLQPFRFTICQETYVENRQEKSEKRWKNTFS